MNPLDFAEALIAQALVAATPLTLAGLGELSAERSGVINVGIEGMMLSGAVAAVSVGSLTGSGLCAVAAGVAAAMALATVFAIATVLMKVDQIVCGMAINLIAVGLSGTLWQVLEAHDLQDLPSSAAFNPLLFGQYGLTYLTIAGVVLWWWMLRSTRAGIIIAGLGEAADACAANGISVRRWRFLLVLLAGACAGAAGTYLSVMRGHGFNPGMTGGRGFLVLALVIFGRWRVGGLVGGCLLFGVLESLQQHLQALGFNQLLPYQALNMLPYLAALVALALLSRSSPGPAELGRPWPERE